MLSYIGFGDFSFSPLKPINNITRAILNKALLASPFRSINPDRFLKNISKVSVHYERNIWNPEFCESLQNDQKVTTDIRQLDELKELVRNMLNDMSIGSLAKSVLIDDLERLGVGYHFEKEIKKALDALYISEDVCNRYDLYFTALSFRLLRQHGYKISEDVFSHLIDEEGSFRLNLTEDVKGMVSLYEASQLCLEGENILDEAKKFTVKHLSALKEYEEVWLAKEVNCALELPLHHRMPRLEARRYIDVYEEKDNMIPVVLQLAKLDFNLLLAIHQNELNNLSRWWEKLGLSSKLSSRDRLVESYLWSIGLTYNPQYRCCREWLTKVVSLVITIDDMYDIYGLLSELELFTSAVERWDLEAIEDLPEYMKICFLALFNTTNDIVYTKCKEDGVYILSYLKKEWARFCKSMLVEAKWSKSGYTPSLTEYLENARVSSSVAVGLIHALFATNQTISNDVLESLNNKPDVIYYSAMIFRLCNDLATSSAELERGDVASAIQCYMCEANTSEHIARDKIKHLISEMWKKLNESRYDSHFDQIFVDIAVNNVRTAHSIYQYGDGISVQDHEARRRVARLLIKPITIQSTETSPSY